MSFSSPSLKERLLAVKKTRWIRFGVAALLFILFTIWLGNYYILPLLIVMADMYLTHYIPWTFWKRSKNKTVLRVMEWGRCHCLCLGGGLSHQYLPLSELQDSHLVARKVAARGRLSLCEQAQLRTACTQHAALVSRSCRTPSRCSTSSRMWSGLRGPITGWPASVRCSGGDIVVLQLPCRRYGGCAGAQPRLLHAGSLCGP